MSPSDTAKQTTSGEPAQDESESDDDRRENQRLRSIKSGLISFQNGHCDMDCVIYDLSETGAKIQPENVLLCPPRFSLQILFGPTYRCEVVHQVGKRLGVRFLSKESDGS